MRPSEFEAIRPHLQEAFDQIDAELNRKQAMEDDPELDELFNRLSALPEGAPPEVKPQELTEEEPARLSARLSRSFHCTPLIEHAYPWRYLASRAAVDLWDCGWKKEAEAIGEVLSELPTGPVDGRHPEIMDRQYDAIRAGAERIRTILAACLAGSTPPADQANESEGNGGKKPHTEEPPKSHIIGDLRDTIRNREWSDGYTLITHIPDSFVLQRLFAYGRQKWGEGLDDREVLNRLIDEVAHFCKKPPNEVSRLSLREFSSLFSKLQAQQTEAERSVTSPAANTDEGEGTGGDVGNASGAALPGPLAASASELPAAVETPSSAPAEPQDQPPRRVGQVCYSATEAGRYIDVHESTIRRWIANHQINVFGEEGTKYWFSLQELVQSER